MFFAGVDIGSVATKAVILQNSAEKPILVGEAILPTGWDNAKAGTEVLERACAKAKISRSDLKFCVATGYGRVAMPSADKAMTEIACHAKGAAFLFDDAGIVLDIGGQDSKVISLEPKTGAVIDFLMNDKCAAGTGRFLQVLSGILNMSLDQLSQAADQGEPLMISSMCTVFAESEIVGLLAKGAKPQDIACGVFLSLAKRMSGLARRLSLHDACVFTGGLANSQTFTKMLEQELAKPVYTSKQPQIVGALGAALFAIAKSQ